MTLVCFRISQDKELVLQVFLVDVSFVFLHITKKDVFSIKLRLEGFLNISYKVDDRKMRPALFFNQLEPG